jgi:rhodanese-related sulfurtransferase
MAGRIDARALKSALHDGGEIALLDAREEVPFDARHLLMASCVPLSRLEMLVDEMVPRRSTRVVWCDDGDGLADRAASRMAALGWTDVSVLEGGIASWEAAGFRLYRGVHVPSKAFAEVVEHEAGTPWITAEQLKAMQDSGADIALFDSRSYEEYHDNSIPGAISVPGAELVHRFADMVPSPDTFVVVNCGGRTRSIIGAQSLIDAGVPNKVVSLQNGTQAWHLAGYQVLKGATAQPPAVSGAGRAASRAAAARVAARSGIRTIDMATLERWRAETERTLYVFDVRTPAEYAAGHVPGVKHIAGGQLVQETDRHAATWGARIVLVDDDGVRATMTAHWMQQMGWEVAVMTLDALGAARATGAHAPRVLGLDGASVTSIDAAALHARLQAGGAVVVDVDWSRGFIAGHIPGAWYAIRALSRGVRRSADDGGDRVHVVRRCARTACGSRVEWSCARPGAGAVRWHGGVGRRGVWAGTWCDAHGERTGGRTAACARTGRQRRGRDAGVSDVGDRAGEPDGNGRRPAVQGGGREAAMSTEHTPLPISTGARPSVSGYRT